MTPEEKAIDITNQILLWTLRQTEEETKKRMISILTIAFGQENEALLFLRNDYSEWGARGCPACDYKSGKFIKLCKLHERIEGLQQTISRYDESLKGLLETAKEYREHQKIALGETRDRKINAMYYKEIEEAEKAINEK